MNDLEMKSGFEGLFGTDYPVCSVERNDAAIVIKLKSCKKESLCPCCGHLSHKVHTTYTRTIQETPFRNTQTWLHVTAQKFDCVNPACPKKVFSEILPFAGQRQVKTVELTLMALEIARNIGNETASTVLSSLGVKMSNDTITRIYEGLDFEDNPFVESIGVDDVANRKGQSYYTVIYELNTHRMLALLLGRDGEPLKEWLRKHPYVRFVARDRASSYAAAISEVLPDAVQVADRFHLIQNIMVRLKDIIKETMPKEIFYAYGDVLEKPPKKETVAPAVEESILSQIHYDNSPPVDELGQPIVFDSKKRDFDSPRYKALAASRKAAQQLIRDMQRFKNENPDASIKELAVHFGVSKYIAKSYMKMTSQEIDAMDSPKAYKKRVTVLDNYINIIFKMLKDGVDTEIIYGYVCQCGYSGNPSTLLGYIETVKKNNFPERKAINPMRMVKLRYTEGTGAVSRSDLLKYVLTCNPKTPLDTKVAGIIDAARDKFPILEYAGKAFHDFHTVIMGASTDALDAFINEYEDSELRAFCENIKKDIAPVKNAISYPLSSGFVEGCNNKFKLIKRSLYGRAKYSNLYKKCMLAFAGNDPAFNLRTLVAA